VQAGQGIRVTMTWMNVSVTPSVAAEKTVVVTTTRERMNAAVLGHTL